MTSFELRQYSLLFLTAVLWGTGFIGQKLGMDHVEPFTFTFMRTLIGGLFLLPVMAAMNGIKRKRGITVRRSDKKTLMLGSLCCGTCLICAESFQQFGIQISDVTSTSFITSLYVVFVPIFGIFIGSRPSPKLVLCVAISVAGLYLLTASGGLHFSKGNLLTLIGALVLIVLIVVVTNAERRIPVQYSKRVVGRKQYGGQSTHLPMKVNMSGVLPVIFAQSIASIPATIAAFSGKTLTWFDTTSLLYALVYFLLIIFFSYFYSTIQFNPIEVANNLKRNGGFIPGYRPGKPTSEFIQKVLNKITLFGAIYLSIVAVTPYLISHWSNVARTSGISLGGTSIIIVVGVALETVQALENQMLMRHYKGFLE